MTNTPPKPSATPPLIPPIVFQDPQYAALALTLANRLPSALEAVEDAHYSGTNTVPPIIDRLAADAKILGFHDVTRSIEQLHALFSDGSPGSLERVFPELRDSTQRILAARDLLTQISKPRE